jgi:hypothetical protein
MNRFASRLAHLALLTFVSSLGWTLSGCAGGPLDTSVAPADMVATTITGRVHGGEQPISGATINLYVTGTTGYGAGATTLIASTTSAISTGNFTFPTSNVPANCTGKGPYAYITASGGDPSGQTTTTTPGWTGGNHAILLAAMLGTCSNVGASTTVDLDEVTTVAAAYALGNFATVSGAAGTLATLNIGAPTTNTQGLADAAANSALLVNTTTGTANASTATVLVPTAAINSLANTLAACVNATEYNAGQCPTIFGLATPPNGSKPSNIFQAAMNIAKFPGQNVTALLGEVSSTPPFAPALAGGTTTATTVSVLNDLSLGIAYLNSTLSTAKTTPVGIAIDNSDNVWVLGAAAKTPAYNYIAELPRASNGGVYTAQLQTAANFASGNTIRNGIFDTSGNLWLSYKGTTGSASGALEVAVANLTASSAINSSTVYQFNTTYTALDANDWILAIDGSNNVWTASYGGQGNCTTATSGTECDYVELAKSSTYAPVDTFGTSSVMEASASVRGIAADAVSTSSGLGNIWTANYGDFSGTAEGGQTLEVLTPSTGALASYIVGPSNSSPYGVALNATGGAYVTTNLATASGLYYVAQGTATGSVASSIDTTGQSTTLANIATTSSAPASSATTAVALGGFNTPGYVAVDGAGNVWVANALLNNSSNGTIIEYSPSLKGILSPYYGFAPSIASAGTSTRQALFTCTTATTTTCSVAGAATSAPLIPIAVDRAGSVWAMDTTGQLMEIIGTAAPTNPILASGATGSLP